MKVTQIQNYCKSLGDGLVVKDMDNLTSSYRFKPLIICTKKHFFKPNQDWLKKNVILKG